MLFNSIHRYVSKYLVYENGKYFCVITYTVDRWTAPHHNTSHLKTDIEKDEMLGFRPLLYLVKMGQALPEAIKWMCETWSGLGLELIGSDNLADASPQHHLGTGARTHGFKGIKDLWNDMIFTEKGDTTQISVSITWFIIEGLQKNLNTSLEEMQEVIHDSILGSYSSPLQASNSTLGLYSLCLISIGIPIINLRRSSDRLRFIMGIPIPVRRRLLSE